MAGIKIVDLPAVGRDLATTDLFEMSLAGGTGSRKITGQEIMNASKLNVGSTPVINGTIGRVLFEGTGNVLQQSGNLFWDNTNVRLGVGTATPNHTLELRNTTGGATTPTLSFVTSTYNSQIIVGNSTYPFALGANSLNVYHGVSGGIGFYNGGATPTLRFSILSDGKTIVGSATTATRIFEVNNTVNGGGIGLNSTAVNTSYAISHTATGANSWSLNSAGTGSSQTAGTLSIGATTNNMLLFSNGNTVLGALGSADAGFRLDVNGTARVTSTLRVESSFTALSTATVGGTTLVANAAFQVNTGGKYVNYNGAYSLGNFLTYQAFGTWEAIGADSPAGTILAFGGYRASQWTGITFHSNGSERMRIHSTGNVGINTTTDAGFRLDVNGDTIFRRITNVTPNTITGGTQFFTVKSGNWPTALIRCFENGVINLGSSSGSIGFDTSIFNLPVSSTFNFNYVPTNQLNTFAFILSANYTNVGAGGTSEGTMLRTSGSTSTSVGAVTMNQIESKPTYNNTGGTTINRGFYYNPILSSMTNTTHYAIHSTSGRVRLEGLPTSPTGLSAGDLYNDAGTIKIV